MTNPPPIRPPPTVQAAAAAPWCLGSVLFVGAFAYCLGYLLSRR